MASSDVRRPAWLAVDAGGSRLAALRYRGAVRRFDTTERQARLARRHHLAPDARASGIAEAARDLVGLHSTDPATVYLSTFTRTAPGDPEADPAAIGRTIYDDRSVVRMLGMRRTMFVEPLELVPVVHAAYARANGGQQRRATIQLLGSAGIADDPARWLAEVEAETLAALTLRGEATATEIAQDVPRLREQIPVGAGKRWEGTIGVSTRVLFRLAAEGRIIRGRPRGSWISSQYRWTTIESWLPEPLVEMSVGVRPGRAHPALAGRVRPGHRRRHQVVDRPDPRRDPPGAGRARGGRRRARGRRRASSCRRRRADPSRRRAVGRAAARARPDGHGLGGRATGSSGRIVRSLFDTNGNAGPTIWSDGRIVGGWAQRRDGQIVLRLLEDVGAERAAAIDAEADRLARWLGPVRITPRFRTPIEKELGV